MLLEVLIHRLEIADLFFIQEEGTLETPLSIEHTLDLVLQEGVMLLQVSVFREDGCFHLPEVLFVAGDCREGRALTSSLFAGSKHWSIHS